VPEPPLATPHVETGLPPVKIRTVAEPRPELPAGKRPGAPKLPAILFEGDELPVGGVVSGAGKPGEGLERAQLPEAYGSGKLGLLARDPHSIYAYWDFSREQQERYNGLSADKHMMLLIWQTGLAQRLVLEIPVHADSRHWFVHVPIAGATYYAELGYYDSNRQWATVAVSEHVDTPGGSPRAQTASAPVFARISVEPEPAVFPGVFGEEPPQPQAGTVQQTVAPTPMPEAEPWSFETPVELGRAYGAGAEAAGGLIPSAQPRRARRAQRTPVPERQASQSWTPEAAREILLISGVTQTARHIDGSIEVVDLFKRWVREGVGISSMEAMEFGLEAERAPQAPVSSPGMPGGLAAPEVPGKPPGFRLDVNADLVIYGSTEPGAKVTIGGRAIRLRPDGSFSYRFTLPDGRYELPIRAVSSGGDVRGATLQFGRETSYEGNVGAHAHDPALTPPAPENIPQ